jgi:hypothetical protein
MHNMIYHIYGSWIGSDYYAQGRAMDEGLADYYACTRKNDPIQGESVGVNRNLDNNTYTWTSWMGAHWNGQVIGGACWDLRQAIGASVTDLLVYRALRITPRATDFDGFLYNMIVADNSYYGGAHLQQFNTAFAAHGIDQVPLSVTFSGPVSLGCDEPGTWVAHPTGGTPPYSYEWLYHSIGDPWSTAGTNQQVTLSACEDFMLKVVVTDSLGQEAESWEERIIICDEPICPE